MLGLAAGTLLQKRWGGGVDARVSVAVQSVTGALVLVPAALVGGQTHIELGTTFVLSVLWLAWGGTVGAMVLQVILLQRLPISIVSGLLLVVPPVTAIMAWLARGDDLAPLSLVGMPVALAAVVLLRTGHRPAVPAPPSAGPALGTVSPR
jgi:drug/metabolite transporter (DMT)-like permease